MIVALLLSLAATIVTGLALYGMAADCRNWNKGMGPIRWLRCWSRAVTQRSTPSRKRTRQRPTAHSLLVAGHLLGVVLWESLLHREK
jgi:hypothetical protein